jgi:uncharacterized membrane protein
MTKGRREGFTDGVVAINLLLLFWLALVPFVIRWRLIAVAIYIVVALL